MRIIDLHVLLYAVNSDAAQHDLVRSWWERALNDEDTVGLAWVVLLGFLRLATNYLAALALSHDAALVSCDADFARFKGLRWENPLGEVRWC